MQLHIVTTCIFRHHGSAVINGVDDFNDRSRRIRHLLGNLDLMISLVGIVFIGENAFPVNIAIDNQIKMDSSCCILIDNLLIALIILDHLTNKQIFRNCTRSIRHSFSDFCLQSLRETVIAFTGNDSQHIDILYFFAQHVGVHTLTVLIHAEAQATPDFLPLTHLTVALLQGADLEYIRVIPALSQRRMREDKTNRRALRIAIQQQLLVLHNQLIGIDIIRRSFLAAHLGVNHLALFVDRKISGVRLLRWNRLQILYVVILADTDLQMSDNVVILLYKHLRIDTVCRLSGFIIDAIFCHFIDEEQGQHLDALIEQLAFSLNMRQNRLSDLNAS